MNRSYTLGINAQSDLTLVEYSQRYTSTSSFASPTTSEKIFSRDPSVGVPHHRLEALGAVTPVGDQGDYCGTASVTFSAADAVEGAWKIAGHHLIPLS